jgi:hypothetical protein
MWNSYFTLLMMITLLRVDYELRRPKETYNDTFVLPLPNRPALSRQQKEWAEKAIKRYAEAQDRKWRRWSQAMFERSG